MSPTTGCVCPHWFSLVFMKDTVLFGAVSDCSIFVTLGWRAYPWGNLVVNRSDFLLALKNKA